MTKKLLIVFIFMLLLINATKVKAAGETSEYMGVYGATIKYVPVGEFQEDSTYSNYYSQKYVIYVERVQIEDFNINIINDVPNGTYIANTDGKRQDSFKSFDRQFKIMIPKDKIEEEFILNVKVMLNFVTYTAKYNSEGEIIATGVSASNSQILTIDNRKSKLNIKCVDDLTNEEIKGVTLKVKDDTFNVQEKYKTNKNGEIKIKKIGRGSATITLDSVPKGYYIDDKEYKVEIQKNSKEEYELRLIPKTGEVRILNNVIGSNFELYDGEGNLVKILENESGTIVIRNLRFGNYVLVQKNITDRFNKVENIAFVISNKLVKELVVENEEKIVVIPPDIGNKPEDKVEEKPENKPEDKVEEKPENKPEDKIEEKPENKPEDKIEEKPENKPEDKIEEKPESKPEEKVEEKAETRVENDKDKKKENVTENPVDLKKNEQQEKNISKKDKITVNKTNNNAEKDIETKDAEYLELVQIENDEAIKFAMTEEKINSDDNKEKLNNNDKKEGEKFEISPMVIFLIILLIIILIILIKKRKQTDKQSAFRS